MGCFHGSGENDSGKVLPRLFFGKTKNLSPILGTLSMMPIKVARLALLNTVTPQKEKYLRSHKGSAELIMDVTGGGALLNSDHLWTILDEMRDVKKEREFVNETKLKGLSRYLKGTERSLLLQAKSSGAWPGVRGTTVSGTVLSAMDFWDLLCARYNVYPVNLQSHWYGYGNTFGVMHTLICITGGPVIARHNEIRD